MSQIITFIRVDADADGTDTYVDVYEVPDGLDKEEVLNLFKRTAKDYLQTEKGCQEFQWNGNAFNWNDFANIPETYLLEHGIHSLPIVSDMVIEVDANEQPGEGVESEGKNTRISYLYRDASNYKRPNEVIVQGTFTSKQIDTIISCLDEGEYFIPDQIGFPEERFGTITEDDHCWFELERDGFEETDKKPDLDMDAEEVVANFLNAKDHWDDVRLFAT